MRKLFCTLLTVLSGLCAQAQHFVLDFDDHNQGWSVSTGNAMVVDGGQKGKALQLDPHSMVTIRMNPQAQATYKLTAYLKTAAGDTHVTLQGTELYGHEFSISSALAAWTKVEQVFSTDAGQRKGGRLEVVFNGSSRAWIDEIVVERIGDYKAPVYKGFVPLKKREVVTDFGVPMQPDDKIQWLRDAKLGLFIHWGLYAGPAQGEWYQQNKGILPEDYRKLAYPESGNEYFDAKDFDARKWTALAKKMGARYATLTTMHHDGYALFESHYMNAFTSKQTHNRDFVREFVDACHEDGLRVGLYKTLINWRFPGYYDVTGTDCKKNSFGYTTAAWHKENARQMKEELYCQTKELLSNYGKIDILFWDGGWIAQKPSDREGARVWESYKYLTTDNPWPVNPLFQVKETSTGKPLGLIGMCRQLQPDILMNPRSGWVGDYTCDEGAHDVKGEIRSGLVEKCMSISSYWGFSHEDEHPEKVLSVQRIKRIFADCLIRNMILHINVGPDRHGNVPKVMEQRLTLFGDWVRENQEAIYATQGGPWQPKENQYGFCYKDDVIYVYLLDGFKGTSLTLPPTDKGYQVVNAYQVADKKTIRVTQRGRRITLHQLQPTGDIQVIALKMNKVIRQ